MNYKDIIIRPIITEKTMRYMDENNVVTFEVKKGSNKILIKQSGTLHRQDQSGPQGLCKNQGRTGYRSVRRSGSEINQGEARYFLNK